jgi:drug/metabolite transporter (DMT)-like permease
MALLEPIGATALGIILFEEGPAPIFVVGAALIMTGILLVVKERK